MKTSINTWQWLGYLGLTPFLACLWLFESPSNNLFFNPQQAFLFYSAIILSFLAGALWRKDSFSAHSTSLIVSNVFCVYACICLFLPVFYALLFLALGYLTLLLAEYLLCNNKENAFTKPYFIMRFILTLFVNVFHGVALISWF